MFYSKTTIIEIIRVALPQLIPRTVDIAKGLNEKYTGALFRLMPVLVGHISQAGICARLLGS